MNATPTLGFVGLGVMGAPMCRNLVLKAGAEVIAYDLRADAVAELARAGATAGASVKEVVARAQTIFLSLPGDGEVREVCLGDEGISRHARAGQIVVDCSTTTVELARELGAAFAVGDVAFADAPVARTREAAESGALSVMVGAEAENFDRIRPALECFASDITHCGGPGSGQAVKILNNMVLFQNVCAIAEALALGRKAGLDGTLLLETLAKGSADSFALRNHGMKSMLPGTFPERAFSTAYAIKDLSYALGLAKEHGLALDGAALVARRFEQSARSGSAELYFPAVLRVIESALERDPA